MNVETETDQRDNKETQILKKMKEEKVFKNQRIGKIEINSVAVKNKSAE